MSDFLTLINGRFCSEFVACFYSMNWFINGVFFLGCALKRMTHKLVWNTNSVLTSLRCKPFTLHHPIKLNSSESPFCLWVPFNKSVIWLTGLGEAGIIYLWQPWKGIPSDILPKTNRPTWPDNSPSLDIGRALTIWQYKLKLSPFLTRLVPSPRNWHNDQ